MTTAAQQHSTAAQRAQHALAVWQAKAIKAERRTMALAAATHRKFGGSTIKDLRRRIIFPAANGFCISCDQLTALDVNPANANAATAGILIPSALCNDEESDVKRSGYVPNNVGLFCRACVSASNGGNNGKPLWIWTADTINAASVPSYWGPLHKDLTPIVYVTNNVDLVAYTRTAAIRRAAKGIIG